MTETKYSLHTKEPAKRSSFRLPEGEKGTVTLIYILYLLGVFLPAFTLVGVVLAYINRADAPDWLYSHYRFQIRTFWLSILLFFIGSILLIIVIGQLVLLFWFVWAMVRIIKGLTLLSRDEAHPNPDTYLFT